MSFGIEFNSNCFSSIRLSRARGFGFVSINFVVGVVWFHHLTTEFLFDDDFQHGPFECLLNTVEACAIHIWPDLVRDSPFGSERETQKTISQVRAQF